MALGMLTIVWNACESRLRSILIDLSSGGDLLRYRLVEPLVIEMGSVSLAQALRCLVSEFPNHAADIGAALDHAITFYERCRSYRNYYVHGISAVTRYGIFCTDEDIGLDTPLHETMREGPFGSIFDKSAKGKNKFRMDFVDRDSLQKFNNTLANYAEYLDGLHLSIRHYFRRFDHKRTAPLPPLPPLPDMLERRALSHPKLQRRPALELHDWIGSFPEQGEEEFARTDLPPNLEG